jgi:hypothetical protein
MTVTRWESVQANTKQILPLLAGFSERMDLLPPDGKVLPWRRYLWQICLRRRGCEVE